jgi:hypothetical protein
MPNSSKVPGEFDADQWLIALPVFRLALIKKRAKRAAELTRKFYAAYPMTPHTRGILASALAKALRLGKTHQVLAVASSLDDLPCGDTVDDKQIDLLAYRLAANRGRLANGVAVPFNQTGVGSHWARVEIVGCGPSKDKRKFRIAYKILSGPLAGRSWTTSMPRGCSRLLYMIITGGGVRGCSYRNPIQLVGAALVLKIGRSGAEISSSQFAVTKSYRDNNRTVVKQTSLAYGLVTKR